MFPFDKPHNELVFENKNKMYGAYVIRREYDYSLKIAVLTGVGFMLVIASVAAYLNKEKTTLPELVKKKTEELITMVNLQKETKVEKQETAIPEKHNTQNKVTPTPTLNNAIVSDETQKPQENHTETTTPFDPNATAGTDSTDVADPNTGSGNSGGGLVAKSEGPAPFELVAPEMPDIDAKGGFLPYVAKHLRYPSEAVENRAQGIVRISFIVEKDGSITNVAIVNKEKIGYGCEEEAIRVIKTAKWKPGRNNDQPVRVQLTMPVKYRLQ